MGAEVQQWLGGGGDKGRATASDQSMVRYLDGTVGGGGHSKMMATALQASGALEWQIWCLDRDPEAIERARTTLAPWIASKHILLQPGCLHEVAGLNDLAGQFDGILLDVGLSSDQVDDPDRGFSFTHDGPLDMRMQRHAHLATAAELLQKTPAEEMARWFYAYGDEPRSRALAAAIAHDRQVRPFTSTQQLRDLMARVLKPRTSAQRNQWIARNFQALRMAVNQELELLTAELNRAVTLLKKGGRLVVIAFHSGEDRLVKHFFRAQSQHCICPPQLLRCSCQHQAALRVLTKKPLRPSAAEIRNNPRSRSALLRVAERL